MKKFRRGDIIFSLFCIWFITNIFSYALYAIYAIQTSTFIYWTYNTADMPGIPGYIVHLKDVVMVILFFALVLKKKIYRAYSVIVPFVIFALIATLVHSFNIFQDMLLAGIREFLPLIICLMMYQENRKSQMSILNMKIFKRVLIVCAVIETLVLFIQITILQIWSSIGSAGYRLPGTFGIGGNLGYFSIGTAVYVYTLYCLNELRKCSTYLLMLLTGVMALASGARNAMIVVAVVAVFLILDLILGSSKVIKKNLYIFALPTLVIFGVPFMNQMTEYVGRGDFDASSGSAGGRIDLFMELFNRSLSELTIGKGIGDRTNALAAMGGDSGISDGTFTAVFAQFGIIGLSVFIIMVIIFVWKLLCCKVLVKNAAIVYVISLIISLLSINVFEQPVLIVLYFVTYCLMDNRMDYMVVNSQEKE